MEINILILIILWTTYSPAFIYPNLSELG